MSPVAFAQLAIILAPIAKEIVIEGNKVITTYRDNLSQADIARALELAKSASWPQLNFGLDDGTPH